MQKFLAVLKAVFVTVRDTARDLNASQRRAIYKLAVAAGVTIVVKFGVSADNATQVVETIGVFVTTVLVPILAHVKVNDD